MYVDGRIGAQSVALFLGPFGSCILNAALLIEESLAGEESVNSMLA
jgi:hypothetical protein